MEWPRLRARGRERERVREKYRVVEGGGERGEGERGREREGGCKPFCQKLENYENCITFNESSWFLKKYIFYKLQKYKLVSRLKSAFF